MAETEARYSCAVEPQDAIEIQFPDPWARVDRVVATKSIQLIGDQRLRPA